MILLPTKNSRDRKCELKFSKPFFGFGVILWGSVAVCAELSQTHLRIRLTLFSSLAIPLHCLAKILSYTTPACIHDAQVILGRCEALLGGFSEPGNCCAVD